MLIQCESPNNLLILSVCSVCTNRNGELDYREDRSLEPKRFETKKAKLGFSLKSFFLDNQAYIEWSWAELSLWSTFNFIKNLFWSTFDFKETFLAPELKASQMDQKRTSRE